MDDELAPAARIRQLIFGRLLSHAVCAAAELRLSDLLAEGPLSIAELADRTGADRPKLGQLMRSLAAFDVYAARPDGTFELAPLGAALRAGARGSALPTALLAAGEVGGAWGGCSKRYERAGRLSRRRKAPGSSTTWTAIHACEDCSTVHRRTIWNWRSISFSGR